MNEERRKKITDMQVRAFMAFARSIRPGWRAKALALPLIALIKLLGIRKDVARRNIMLCFPEKSRAERERILAESYENMIWTSRALRRPDAHRPHGRKRRRHGTHRKRLRARQGHRDILSAPRQLGALARVVLASLALLRRRAQLRQPLPARAHSDASRDLGSRPSTKKRP